MTEPPEFSSITVSATDGAIMYCLGAIRRWAMRGTKDPDQRHPEKFLEWAPDHIKAVMYFPTREAEDRFLTKAQQILPPGSWSWTKMDE